MSKYFLGALTPSGFVSHFQNIIDYQEGNRLFILKGGSGIGKSTFLKKIKQRLTDRGLPCDEFFCSNAPTSLDGVLFPTAKIAVVDGTNPHVVEPRCYGIFDQTINLGEAINHAPQTLLPKIKDIQKIKSDYNASFVNHLVSAYHLYLDTHRIYGDSIIKNAAAEMTAQILSRFENLKKLPKLRKTFISALTLDGYKSFLSNQTFKDCICLSNGFLSVNSVIITDMANTLLERGYNVTAFCNNFEPTLYQGIFVEDTQTLIYSTGFLDATVLDGATKADMDIVTALSPSQKNDVEDNILLMNEILQQCYKQAQLAAKYHDELESLFYSYVDFSVNDRLLQEFFESIGM